jgi:hypothetical protein
MTKEPLTYNIGGQALSAPGLKIQKGFIWPVGTDSQSNMLTNPSSSNNILQYNGSGIPHSQPVTLASGVLNMMVMNQGDYDSLTPKNSQTIYFIT